MTTDSYWQDKVAPPGSTLYYSLRTLTPAKRNALLSLHALAKELHDTVHRVSDPGIARIKLDWWREELQNSYSGNARHPVAQALTETLREWQLSEEYFAELIDGIETNLTRSGFESFNELALYCHRVSGTIGQMSSEVLGYKHRQTLDFGARLGTALSLTHQLNNLAEDILHGRIRIPREELQRFGVSSARLLERKPGPELDALLKFQSERAHRYFREAMDLLPEADRYTQTPHLIMARIQEMVLTEIDKNYPAMLNQTMDLTPVRKLWIAWTTERNKRRLFRGKV